MLHDPEILTDLSTLNTRFANDASGALRFALSGSWGKVALVSSFGADSAVLLHMVAQIDRATPVIFIDTLMLFPETLAYQRELAAHLGLTGLRRIEPDRVSLFLQDPDAILHKGNTDACCNLRKTQALDLALAGYNGWISGRKRYQSGPRAHIPLFEREAETSRVKINPLADQSADDLRAYMDRFGLPRHPLVARGYPSLGCAPCTTPAAAGEDPRAGRWRGSAKVECGIHINDGQIVRRVAS